MKKNHRHESPILEDVDIEKVLVSYFIGYLYNYHKIKSLHIMLPKTSAYVKSYDGQTKWMYFLIKYDNLLEEYNTIWENVSADIKKEFDSQSV